MNPWANAVDMNLKAKCAKCGCKMTYILAKNAQDLEIIKREVKAKKCLCSNCEEGNPLDDLLP